MRPLLLAYGSASLCYAALLAGSGAPPLQGFPVYSAAAGSCILLALLAAAFAGLWRPRLPSAQDALTGAATIGVVVSSTLALLVPASVLAVLGQKVGCLLVAERPAEVSRLRWLSALSLGVLAIAASAVHAPRRAAWEACALAVLYVASYKLKLRASGDPSRPVDLGAEQLVVAALLLTASAALGGPGGSTLAGDWRLWAAGLASTAAGISSTAIILIPSRRGLNFVAYRMAGLLAALASQALAGRATLWTLGASAAGAAAAYLSLPPNTSPKPSSRGASSSGLPRRFTSTGAPDASLPSLPPTV